MQPKFSGSEFLTQKFLPPLLKLGPLLLLLTEVVPRRNLAIAGHSTTKLGRSPLFNPSHNASLSARHTTIKPAEAEGNLTLRINTHINTRNIIVSQVKNSEGTDPRLNKNPGLNENQNQQAAEKIRFDLSQISASGLIGPPGGQRYLDYEFCVPRQATAIVAVRSINPRLQLFTGSPGRIGCTATQYLMVGSTNSVNWRSQLLQLADLNYIQTIQQTFWE